MLSEIYGLLSSISTEGKGAGRKIMVNFNKNRIRSISAFSSNTIFYFPTIISDQTMPDESSMVLRMLEKSYASFVVACISLMPFHRIRADDQAAVEDYLSQFHQNIGMGGGGAAVGRALTKMAMEESAAGDAAVQELQDFLYECWQKAQATNSDFIKLVSETVSLNDMFNEDAVDPKTRVLQAQFIELQEEANTWGFIGEATVDMFDTDDDDLLDLSDDEIWDDDPDEDEFDDSVLDEGVIRDAINNIKFSLESVSENKILSCSNLTKLRALESKLNKLKNKYTRYLNRYKKKYKENQEKGTKSKLAIRFNNMAISNPKAFMKQYGSYIKIINKRLKLIEKRRAELRKRKGIEDTGSDVKLEENVLTMLTDMDLQAIDFCCETVDSWLNAPDSEIFTITEDADDVDWDAILNWYDDPDATPRQVEIMKNLRNQLNVEIQKGAELAARAAKADNAAEKVAIEARKQKLRAKFAEQNGAKARQQITALEKELNDLRADNARLVKRYGPSRPDSNGMLANPNRPQSGLDMGRVAAANRNGPTKFETFDKQVFTDMDMKKANEAIPTFAKASIGFIVDETEEVVSRDVLVGIKCYLHRAPAAELVSDIYNCIINKRKFLKFVKFITGEERSLSDLLFGFKELRHDALGTRGGAGQWQSAFKRRQRWSKISIPYLMKEYTPNGTIVMTMNEVNFIRDQYGVDIMTPDHVKMIMDSDFLLGFAILDQANEMVYITYDGHGGQFQQYTYAMLERERNTSDRMMRELYRAMAR